MTKPWWQSKTLWFNVLVAALAALEANGGLLQPYLPGNAYGWGMVVLSVGNAALRLITASAVTLK